MAATVTEDFEYVTQFFGFTPKSFVDGVYNAINDYVREGFKEMATSLEEGCAESDDTCSSKIREGCQRLVAKCYQTVDDTIDKMELYMLNNIFVIQSGVLLSEDHVHENVKDGLSDSEENIDKAILELKICIKKELFVKQMIQSEQEKLGKVLDDLKRLEQWFDDICGEIKSKNLNEIINSVCINSLEIKDILQTQQQMNIK